MLNVQNISYHYGTKPVIENITLQFPLGKIIGIAGENGCGKSTLIRLLCGIIRPKEGTIFLDNKIVTRRSASAIAYLPDTDLFYSHSTGQEIFKFYATQFNDFSYDKAMIIAEFLQVATNEKTSKLSKGKRALIKMAATLGRNVPYYIMDEPFAGIDPMAREALIKGLLQFTEPDEQTIILSTHEIREVEPILDALILIKNHNVIAYETLEEIRDELRQDAVAWMKNIYLEE